MKSKFKIVKIIKKIVTVKGKAPHNAVNKIKVPPIKPLTIKVDFKFLNVTKLINNLIDFKFISSIRLVFNFSWYLFNEFKLVNEKIIKLIIPRVLIIGERATVETITREVNVTTLIIEAINSVKALVHFIQNKTKIHITTSAKTIAANENLITI